jgi:hypothetical protein
MNFGWYDLDELREEMHRRFPKKGHATQFAHDHGLLVETMQSFMRGSRPPADRLLSLLGWERKYFYRKKKDA